MHFWPPKNHPPSKTVSTQFSFGLDATGLFGLRKMTVFSNNPGVFNYLIYAVRDRLAAQTKRCLDADLQVCLS